METWQTSTRFYVTQVAVFQFVALAEMCFSPKYVFEVEHYTAPLGIIYIGFSNSCLIYTPLISAGSSVALAVHHALLHSAVARASAALAGTSVKN